MIRVLFICLGNICRSPMAEAIFRQMIEQRGLSDVVEVDSAGIGNWHAGDKPHRGTQLVLDRHEIDWSGIRSRQVTRSELDEVDYIIAMDNGNMEALSRLGAKSSDRVFRLLDLVTDSPSHEVPDPYFDGKFDVVYDLIWFGCEALMQRVVDDLQRLS